MAQQDIIKSLLFSIFGILFIGVMSYLAVGIISSSTYENEITEELAIPKRYVWKYLTELDSLTQNRPDVEESEVLGLNEINLEKWREITDSKGFVEMEFLEKVPDSKVTIKMSRSSFGMTGEWTYTIKGNEETCTLTISEKSETPNIVPRAMMTLGGRDSYLKNQFSILKLSFEEAKK